MAASSETLERPVCYYHGGCPVCRTEIEHYKRGSGGDRVTWRDLSAEPEALAAFGIDRAGAKRRLHVLDETGRLHVGVDAFVVLWQRMPRYRWLARLAASRPLRPAAVALYDKVLAPLLFWWNKRQGRI
jgi:predicted DCC family thiol-disulfide oxidoreductase YuxK